ncbi:uncharacterized protein LOC142976162 [Anticarsia gemmatalis]|uniref:uncharacterized protein LOC142976162 n=1 Tax=Anticarsia gemmatalis TaxID=129554 RepID=UPI003F76D3A6
MTRATGTNLPKKTGANQICPTNQSKTMISTEPYCHVKVDSIIRLKDSTKKLLYLLEDIQLKTNTKNLCNVQEPHSRETPAASRPVAARGDVVDSVTDVCAYALRRLESQTKLLETIPVEDEDDDCSVFKRLTRKCVCLNQQEYNDFIIHFNEDTRYFTSTVGEIIKNLRILKKFLYMGGDYTKHALMFLNEGLGDSSFAEKVEIIQGCAHADMCNVFDDYSIVIKCIAWPYKYDTYGDTVTQELTAAYLHKLAQLEEGRRYLKFTSKITIDIKKTLRSKGAKLDYNTIEALTATLNEMDPLNKTENVTVTYYGRPSDEGLGTQVMKALMKYREYMTLCEIFTHLDVLNKLSNEDKGKTELITCLRPLVGMFKEMLMEYDDSEMNIIIANILNNLVTKTLIQQADSDLPKVLTMATTATETIRTKNECVQKPSPKKLNKKNFAKSKNFINHSSRKLGSSRRKVTSESRVLNKPQRFKEKHHIIIVPLEKKNTTRL